MEEKSEYLKKIDELYLLITSMLEDLNNSNEILGLLLVISQTNANYSFVNSLIRMRVKQAISYLESTCYALKMFAFELCSIKRREIEPRFAALFSINTRLDVKKKIKDSLKFVAAVLNRGTCPDFSTEEWHKVCELIEIRHRLTHPNKKEDLDVTVKELELVNIATFWMPKQMYRIIGAELPEVSLKPGEGDIGNMLNNLKEKFPIFK